MSKRESSDNLLFDKDIRRNSKPDADTLTTGAIEKLLYKMSIDKIERKMRR